MKKLLLALLISLTPASALADGSTTVPSSVGVQRIISFVETTPATFGYVQTTAGDTITLDAQNVGVPASSGTTVTGAQAGIYSITGTPSGTVNLTIGNIITPTSPNGSASIGNFTASFIGSSSTSPTSTVNLDSTGSATINNVRLVITVNPNPTVGKYTGSFDITGSY